MFILLLSLLLVVVVLVLVLSLRYLMYHVILCVLLYMYIVNRAEVATPCPGAPLPVSPPPAATPRPRRPAAFRTDSEHLVKAMQSTKAAAGWQFLLLDCGARARTKGLILFTETGGCRERGGGFQTTRSSGKSTYQGKPRIGPSET